MYRILIAEDDANMRGLLLKAIRKAGFQGVEAGDGAEALRLHGETPVDLMVLDLMMPVMTGFEVLRRLRPQDEVPILMLTAQGQEACRLEGFALGADDYLVKPFSTGELLARIRAILRRTTRIRELPTLASGPFVLDRAARRLLRDGEDQGLSLVEFHVLEVLMRHPGETLSRLEVLNLAWPSDAKPSPRTVDVHIANLRRKLTRPEDPAWILSGRAQGYGWSGPTSGT